MGDGDGARRLRLGALVLQTDRWSGLAERFRQVEATGYDVAYVADHLTHPTLPGRWLAEPWPTLAAAASVTRAIDLGTLVASSAFRTPVTLARLAATTHDVCGGRLVLGLGAGTDYCAAADRGERPTQGAMSGRFADMVAGLAAVWDERADWSGASMAYAGVHTRSRPEGQDPPFLLLAAHGPRAIDLVGRVGDGWSTFGGPGTGTLDEDGFWQAVAEQSDRVTEACRRHGRDPAALRRSLLLGYGTVRPVESVASYVRCAERAVDAGLDELVVYWPEGARGSRFWSDIDVHADGVRAVRAALGDDGPWTPTGS